VDKHHTKKNQISHEIRTHGPERGHTRRSTSKNAQDRGKRHSTEESYGEETDNYTNLLVAKLVHIPKGKERRGNIPRAMTLKSLINPNPQLSMEKLRRGKKKKSSY
jgi:hypothetical protein